MHSVKWTFRTVHCLKCDNKLFPVNISYFGGLEIISNNLHNHSTFCAGANYIWEEFELISEVVKPFYDADYLHQP